MHSGLFLDRDGLVCSDVGWSVTVIVTFMLCVWGEASLNVFCSALGCWWVFSVFFGIAYKTVMVSD